MGHPSTPVPLNDSVKVEDSASTIRCSGSCEEMYLTYGREEHDLRIQMAIEVSKTLG